MRKLLAFLGTVGVTAFGQVTAVVEAAQPQPRMIVINQGKAPLEAVLVTLATGGRMAVASPDALMRPTFKPIAPGGRAVVQIAESLDTAAQVRAAIFQDGSTFGESKWLSLMVERRLHYIGALDGFLEELKGFTESDTREALVQRLQAVREAQFALIPPAVESTPDIDPFNLSMMRSSLQREGVNTVYRLVNANLRNPVVGSDGVAVPLPASVAKLTGILRQQRSRFP